MKPIWLATQNKHKVLELKSYLEPLGYNVKSALDMSHYPHIEENGTTFKANALVKAQHLFKLVGAPVLADDSGIEVMSLNRAPGVYSARFAGEHASDVQNCHKLLHELKDKKDRSAQMVCALCYIDQSGMEHFFVGTCLGSILHEPHGASGFGYDPLFWSDQLQKSFAEASDAEKNTASHRAKALEQFCDYVQKEEQYETISDL